MASKKQGDFLECCIVPDIAALSEPLRNATGSVSGATMTATATLLACRSSGP